MEDLLQIGYDENIDDSEGRKDISTMLVVRTNKNKMYVITQFWGEEAERLHEILIGNKQLPQDTNKRIEQLENKNKELNRILSKVNAAMEEW